MPIVTDNGANEVLLITSAQDAFDEGMVVSCCITAIVAILAAINRLDNDA